MVLVFSALKPLIVPGPALTSQLDAPTPRRTGAGFKLLANHDFENCGLQQLVDLFAGVLSGLNVF